MENIQFAKLAEITEAVDAGELDIADAVAELERRVQKRIAAGKHPMPFVVAALENLKVAA